MLKYSEDPIAFEWRSETITGEQTPQQGVLIGDPSVYTTPSEVPTTPDYRPIGSFPLYKNNQPPDSRSPFFQSNNGAGLIQKTPFYRVSTNQLYFVQSSSDYDQFAPLRFYSSETEIQGVYSDFTDKTLQNMYQSDFSKNFGLRLKGFESLEYSFSKIEAPFTNNPPLYFQILAPVNAKGYFYSPSLLAELSQLRRYGFPRGARVVDDRLRSRKVGSSVLIGQWFRNVGYNDPFLMFPFDSLWIEIPITGGTKTMQRFTIRNILFETGPVGQVYSGPYPNGGYALQTQADPSATLVAAQVQSVTGNPNRQYVVDMATRKVRVYNYVSGEWVEQAVNQNLAGEECVQVLIYKL